MEKSKVYFTNLKVSSRMNLLNKLENLVKKAGIEKIDFKNKFAAIKIHFGEPGNLAYLRPNYAKVIVDIVKELGGKPFLTDCNTLYVGRRKNGLDHLDSAYENGFSPFSTGCHVIIGDGIKGTDEEIVNINGKYVKEAKIGKAIMDADIFISLSHFKGHECTGFGGAVKNIGMGCGSRAGKMEMHSSGKPFVSQEMCVACKACINHCAHDAISIIDKRAVIDNSKCVGCGRCIGTCNVDAIKTPGDESNDILSMKMSEYTKAVLDGRPHFHISLVIDVSPYCDCHSSNDLPIVEDVGMFASFDPIALDMACVDKVNSLKPLPSSVLESKMKKGINIDNLSTNHPNTNWKISLEYGEELGIGTMNYELVEI